MNLPEFGVRKPVVANLVMWALVGAGLIFGLNLRREFFPQVDSTEVIISAPYPGASPDEIEKSLAIKIEDRIAELDDVEEISTTIVEGALTMTVEFVTDKDINVAIDEVKREIDALQDLPEQSERITVIEFKRQLPVIDLTLYGYGDERVMKDAVRRMRDDLLRLPGMGDIAISGVRTDEIAVEVRPSAMIEHRLSLPAVAERIRRAMTEVPGGTVRTPGANVSLRTVAADEKADEVREIVVKSPPRGRPVRVSDIADVTYGFQDIDTRLRFNNKPAVGLTCFAEGDRDTIEIADMVKAYRAGRVREAIDYTILEWLAVTGAAGDPDRLPKRVQAYRAGLARPPIPVDQLATDNDLSRFISQRLELLSRNAFWGAVLVFITLMLLLAPRVALWVTVGLIVAVLGTLAAMHFIGITLNLLTMFGLIVVLGLLVDDAIVVAENITAHWEKGDRPIRAAITGARQVQWPVVATVLTSIAAFWPLRLIEGQLGDQMGLLPIVVVCALGVSLIESLLILPAHMGHSLERAEARKDRTRGPAARFFERLDGLRVRFLQDLIVPRYVRLLDICLRHRYVAFCIALAALIASAGMVAGRRLPFVFLASADSELLIAELKMPIGTPIDKTDAVMQRIEQVTLDQPEVLTAYSGIGARQSLEGGDFVAQPHLAQMFVELKPVEERMDGGRSSEQIKTAILRELGEMTGVKSLRISEIAGGPSGPDISFAVIGDDIRQIERVVERIETALDRTEGVFGVANDADAGQRELRFRLRPEATELGLTDQDVATQARAAVYGLEAYTFAGIREDVDVRVMLDRPTRRSLAALERLHIFTPEGEPTPLREVVEVDESTSYATIRRLDRRRAVTISADVDGAIANTEQVTASLAPLFREVREENPGVRVIPRGRQQEMKEAFETLPLGILMAIGVVYVILVWLFSSFTQPVVILGAVPFALVGVIWGHILLGYEATFLSLIGLVALIGIVVNDSLIFMDFFNSQIRHGHPIFTALLETGRARFRAILLTTTTTVLGLSPLMLEQSFQARFLIPMAITISFGLMGATVVTLIILPCLLLIGADIRRLAHVLWTGELGEPPTPSARREDIIAAALAASTLDYNDDATSRDDDA
ncbi:MAG: efflux RND transporter permease subunit [Phycisphaerales bacterium]